MSGPTIVYSRPASGRQYHRRLLFEGSEEAEPAALCGFVPVRWSGRKGTPDRPTSRRVCGRCDRLAGEQEKRDA